VWRINEACPDIPAVSAAGGLGKFSMGNQRRAYAKVFAVVISGNNPPVLGS